MQFLARRDHSRAELRGKLQSYIEAEDRFRQLAPEYLDGLLDDLTARGWLSDVRAASQLVHKKRSRFGTQRIINELRQMGIPEDLVSAEIPALKASELEAVREVWQKKFGVIPIEPESKARQIRFLQSRGFEFNEIIQVLKPPRSSQD